MLKKLLSMDISKGSAWFVGDVCGLVSSFNNISHMTR